jgi:vitamin B12 transporter
MTRTRLLASAAALAILPHAAMAQDAFLLDEIVISPNATPTLRERAGASVIVVTEDDLRAAGDVQLTDYLARLPGVSIVQNGPTGTFADLRIRGAGSRYISVFVDGILVTDPSTPSGQFEDFGGLTTGGIRRVEILKGAQSALYGGTAVGGVISITTLGGPELGEGTHQRAGGTAGSFGTFAGDYSFTRNTGPLSLSFALSHAQADGFSAASEANGNTEDDGFDRSRLSFGAQYAVSEALTVGINGFAETGSSDFDDFQSVPPFLPTDGDGTSDRDTRGLRAFAQYDLGIWENETAASLYTTDRTSTSSGFTSEFSSRRIALDHLSSAMVRSDLRLSFGLSFRDEEAEATSLPGGSETTTTAGGFVEAVWSPSDRLDLTGTIRYDDHSEFGGFTTGRLAFAFRPAEGTVLRGAVGTGYRPPSIGELFDDFGFFVGNPDLDPETSTSIEVGIDQVWANGAILSATVFESRIDDLITFVPGAPSTLENISGETRIRGIELGGRVPLGLVFTGYGAFTFLDAETATGEPQPRTPERDLVLGMEAAFTDRLGADLWVQAVSGIPEVDDYETLNASVSYAVTEGIDLTLRGLNLTDEDYETVPGYGTAGRAFYVGFDARF